MIPINRTAEILLRQKFLSRHRQTAQEHATNPYPYPPNPWYNREKKDVEGTKHDGQETGRFAVAGNHVLSNAES